MGIGSKRMAHLIVVRNVVRASIRPTIGRQLRLRSTAAADANPVINSDASSTALKAFHKTNLIAVGLAPVACLCPENVPVLPSAVNVFLGVVFPIHGHVGMNGIVTDYAAKLFG